MKRNFESVSKLVLSTTLAITMIACSGTDGEGGPENDSGGAPLATSGSGGDTTAAGASVGGGGGAPGSGGSGGVTPSGGTAGEIDPNPSGGTASEAGGSAGDDSDGSGGESSGGTCNAGTVVEGGGTDTCPDLPWRCSDAMVGSPPVELSGAECSDEHSGACCNFSDKCLMNTDGTPGSLSATEIAVGPCQVGCVADPTTCLDCINAGLSSAGLPALSAGCGACSTNLITCSAAKCLVPCLADANATACRQCVFTECTVGVGNFNECSGLLSTGGL